jgi:hypothetical protein
MRGTKSKFIFGIMIVFLLAISMNGYAAEKQTRVDVLFMNHGPLMDTLNEMKTLFARYGNRISVSWHDFDTAEGEAFMARKGIRQHTPLGIWINGNLSAKADRKEITFSGFPTGSGPVFFQGKWTMEDLKTALDQATTKK